LAFPSKIRRIFHQRTGKSLRTTALQEICLFIDQFLNEVAQASKEISDIDKRKTIDSLHISLAIKKVLDKRCLKNE